VVSKAFQILSDADKKRIYDQTGSDPDSRSGFASRASSASAGGQPFTGDISPDDLFNMFFGGGGPGAAQFGFGGPGFGGPGIRVHTFGGGSPFAAFTQGAGQRARNQPEEPFSMRNLMQLLPLVLLFFVPLLFSILGDSSNGVRPASFEFKHVAPYTVERHTPLHHIPYFVRPDEVSNMPERKLRQLDRQAEVSYIQRMKTRCYNEYELKQQKIADSRGWFFVDLDAYNEALKIPLPSCDRLDDLGVAYTR
jgi:DnaJ family protein B protein 12